MSKFADHFYHPSVCQFCKNAASNLKMCENCKTVSYCSKKHQKLDLVKHKSFCKVITYLEKICTVEMENLINDRLFYLSIVVHYWRERMKRHIFQGEFNIITYRRFCVVCNARNCPFQCQVCLSEFYCSVEHQKTHKSKHKTYCLLLKVNFDLLLFNSKNAISVPLFTAITMRKDLKKFPKDLMKLIEIFVGESYVVFKQYISDVCESVSLIDLFAPAANILFGLEKAKLLKNRKLRKTKLVVHIVGADAVEESWNWGFFMEFIFHWIKNLKKLTVVVIGPEVKPLKKILNQSDVCGLCKISTSNAICLSVSKFYHNVDKVVKPDIIVGFNCGIFLFPSWIESIPRLLKYKGVPLLLTDYTLDYITKDLHTVRNNTPKKIKIVVNPQENPFSCVSPERSFDVRRNPPVHFKNAFLTLIVPK